MPNRYAIDRWAELIIPAVFQAEHELLKANPEWVERLRHSVNPGGEDRHKLADEYCRAIARIIVEHCSNE